MIHQLKKLRGLIDDYESLVSAMDHVLNEWEEGICSNGESEDGLRRVGPDVQLDKDVQMEQKYEQIYASCQEIVEVGLI